ncbi:hypothetical protein LIA77_07529 [Sarocladium implicatum]|nr:hypothetical protein LIA77_07529 [Sarocladium implicatum]
MKLAECTCVIRRGRIAELPARLDNPNILAFLITQSLITYLVNWRECESEGFYHIGADSQFAGIPSSYDVIRCFDSLPASLSSHAEALGLSHPEHVSVHLHDGSLGQCEATMCWRAVSLPIGVYVSVIDVDGCVHLTQSGCLFASDRNFGPTYRSVLQRI